MPSFMDSTDRKRKPPTNTPAYGGTSSHWVGPDLSDAEKARCKVWGEFDVDAETILNDLCSSGFKITIKLERGEATGICFIQPAEDTHPFWGWTLSGRGSTAWKALKQACFRHYVQFEQKWPLDDAPRGRKEFND